MTQPRRRDSLKLDDEALLLECEVDLFRSHGPGGQKRNKTDSAVRLRHGPTGLSSVGVESRSQHENKARALRRLRHTLALHDRWLTDLRDYRPSPLLDGYRTRSRGRRRASEEDTPEAAAGAEEGAGLAINLKNEDYPVVLREVLDVLFACDLRVSEAAEALRLTTSQLVKFLRNDGLAWGHVNQQRVARGEKALR